MVNRSPSPPPSSPAPPPHPDSPPDFVPIPRQLKCSDGWTIARQRGFIAALARCGSVKVACKSVGMSYANVHKLRQNAGAGSFCAAWDAAIEQATGRIAETMIDHAINGVPETVIAGGGKRIERRRFNHRIMMWLLQHHRPKKYGAGYRSAFAADEDEGEDDEEAIERIMFRLDALRAAAGLDDGGRDAGGE